MQPEGRIDRSHYPPIKKFALDDPEANDDDLSATTTAAERLAVMWTLAEMNWELMGQRVHATRLQRHVAHFFRREN